MASLHYAEAQQKELSSVYKTIKRLSEGDQKDKDLYMGLFETVGFSKARSYAKKESRYNLLLPTKRVGCYPAVTWGT